MAKRPPQLDATALRFLNTQDMTEVHVMQGQKADHERQARIYQQTLKHEACRFGDGLIFYLVGHRELSPQQHVWAFVLGVLNVRDSFPEGTELFDDYADWGGHELHLDVKVQPPKTKDPDTEKTVAFPFDDEPHQAACKLAERIATYIGMKKHAVNLTNEQTAYGIGRAFHNLRSTYPQDLGGVHSFDAYAAAAGEYFDTYKNT